MSRKKNLKKVCEYVVFLPETLEGIEGYGKIRKLGATMASSLDDAVGNVVFRQLDRGRGRLVMYKLNRNGGDRGLGKYAIMVPEVVPVSGRKLSLEESQIMTEYALAQELAGGRTPDSMTIKRARACLDYRF